MNLESDLAEMPGLPPQRAAQLARFGLRTLGNVLTHFPHRYEDRRHFASFPSGESDAPVCACGIVVKTADKRLGGWKKMFEVTLQEEDAHALSPSLTCRWFNVHFVQKMIATGQRLVVFGKPKLRGGRVCMDHPEFEVIENDDEVSIHLRRIVPVHPATEGLSPRVLRRLIWDALEVLDPGSVAQLLPSPLDPMPRAEALRQIHFPDSMESQERARRHLVLEEFFAMQLSICAKRAEHDAQPGEPHAGEGALMRRLHEALPFALTGAQRRTIEEIRRDLAGTRPMNRLLHGDVGSGKTLVALSAALLAIESGFQAAVMAPTQILAEQHYLNFQRLIAPLGVTVALRTGARSEDTAMPLFDGSGTARVSLVVGTHALLYDGAPFTRLGLVIIDEQHKFGVMQRARLTSQGTAPDVLVMTATPIPRTLTMTLYGDLDVSVLDELPAHRGKIITRVRDESKLPDAAAFIRGQLEAGRQAYIVYPLIDESAKLEAKAAAHEYERWRDLLSPMRCELLHGRIPPDEKDAIMERFRSGATQVLVATSVIEVGIDVPNATVMLVENAERFGLAQLHQLRGRIGRGEHKSYCILIAKSKNEEAQEKLRVLEESADGFKIAEADLALRGPGDILGTAQSGLPPLKLGDPRKDAVLMQLARQVASQIFETDPALAQPENQRFRSLIVESRKLMLAQVS